MHALSSGFLALGATSSFLIYIGLMLSVGIVASYLVKNLDDFILGGRNLSAFVSALSAGASDMSGWLMMALPGAIYVSGLRECWMAIGLLLGSYCNWRFVAKRLRIYTEKLGNALTIPEYLKSRFEDEGGVLLFVSGAVIFFFFTVYVAAGFVASAILFQSAFDISYKLALLFGVLSTVSYVFIGGFLAVCWTDTIQGVLIFLALTILPILVFVSMYIHGTSVSELILRERGSGFLDFWGW